MLSRSHGFAAIQVRRVVKTKTMMTVARSIHTSNGSRLLSFVSCGGDPLRHLNLHCWLCRYFEDRMGWTLTNIWHLITYDVEDTIYQTAKLVLDEEGVDEEVRKLRAATIKEIGTIFQVGCTFPPRPSRSSLACMRAARLPGLSPCLAMVTLGSC